MSAARRSSCMGKVGVLVWFLQSDCIISIRRVNQKLRRAVVLEGAMTK